LGNFGVAVMALPDNQSTPSPYKGREGRTNELARIAAAGNAIKTGRIAADYGVDGGGDPFDGLAANHNFKVIVRNAVMLPLFTRDLI
jgi:hypothetical protein